MPIDERMDEREKTAHDICDLIHSAADVARSAIMSDDAEAEKALKLAAKTLLENAIRKMDESVGTAVADEDEE